VGVASRVEFITLVQRRPYKSNPALTQGTGTESGKTNEGPNARVVIVSSGQRPARSEVKYETWRPYPNKEPPQ
jgi:hypothetical protein